MAGYYRSSQVIERALELYTHFSLLNGVIRAKQSHSKIQYRFIAGPYDEVPSKSNPLDYIEDEVIAMFNLGKKDA